MQYTDTISLDVDNLTDIFDTLIIKRAELKKIEQKLQKELSRIDFKKNNILHKIEFERDKDIINGYKMYQQLREICRVRRICKRKLYKIQRLNDIKPASRSTRELKENYINDIRLVKQWNG